MKYYPDLQMKNNFENYQISERNRRQFIFVLTDDIDDDTYSEMIRYPFTFRVKSEGRPALLFAFTEAMFDFQEDFFGMEQYTPPRYNCELCGFSNNSKAKWNVHISTNKHRRRAGLPLIENKKMGNSSRTYHCEACLYTPKDATSRCSMRSHTKTNKHKIHCEARGVDPELCMTAVEDKKEEETE